MELDELTKKLRGHNVDLDVDEQYKSYVHETGKVDVSTFIDHLHAKGDLDSSTYLDVVDEAGVSSVPKPASEVSQVNTNTPGPAPTRTDGPKLSLQGWIGRGGMGEVRVAVDNELLRRVAYKCMLPEHTHEQLVRRFLAEARITAQLSHPNIVPVYSLEETDKGQPAYTMKLVRGRTLEDVIKQAQDEVRKGKISRELRLSRRLDMFIKVCEAMDYSHAKGVVHRDLKPENVMVGPFGEVYVMDWGLARVLDEEELALPEMDDKVLLSGSGQRLYERTRAGSLLGTLDYMSPEQAHGQGESLDAQSDIYTLGLILHELIYLVQPIRGGKGKGDRDLWLERAQSAWRAQTHPGTVGERVPPDLNAVLRKACAASPRRRYNRVAELASDVRHALRDEPILARPDGFARGLRRALRRNALLVFGTMATLVGFMALGTGLRMYQEQLNRVEAEVRSQEHAREVAEFRAFIQKRADMVDTSFVWYEGLLEGVVASVLASFDDDVQVGGPIYGVHSFEQVGTAPADWAQRPGWTLPISLEEPMYVTAPGVERSVWEPLVRRSIGAMPVMKQLVRFTPFGDQVDPETAPEISVPWVYVGLEAAGGMVIYPGSRGQVADDFDVRQRPWYRDAVAVGKRRWSTPYLDGMGSGYVMTCTSPIHDAQGELIGVAALDLALGVTSPALRERSARIEGDRAPNIHQAFWVRPDMSMLARSEPGQSQIMPNDDGVEEPLDDWVPPEVVEQLEVKFTGLMLVDDDQGKSWLYTWSFLEHQGWTMLVKADPEHLFDQT